MLCPRVRQPRVTNGLARAVGRAGQDLADGDLKTPHCGTECLRPLPARGIELTLALRVVGIGSLLVRRLLR
jgi:hypothetical protein